ncbi:tyrosine-type recombinase/integrase [Verrucosispora sp. WMMD1129]|uniref:tyrosine-type recombinase/integrase n=1 Tax=Verrucosispora sp. WMMD1129 TaxID=3016093 RepID=UPI00249A3600|nr:tyrosine-type recombinase/integrase [Verrucosispora sp. WMMD1129]WFE44658.1 tyrosine-type recombinase/integrase [Verrucosispora sp. WMMD1129]
MAPRRVRRQPARGPLLAAGAPQPGPAARDEDLEPNEAGIRSLIFGTPKTARGRRTVTFTPKVAEALSALVVGKSRDEFVFATPNGEPVRARNFRRGWLTSVEAAGLSGLRIHDLRHTQAAADLAERAAVGDLPAAGPRERCGHRWSDLGLWAGPIPFGHPPVRPLRGGA